MEYTFIYNVYMDILYIIYTYNVCTMEYIGVLFSNKEEENYVICRKMDGTGDQHDK
jgi:hypothetical protein